MKKFKNLIRVMFLAFFAIWIYWVFFVDSTVYPYFMIVGWIMILTLHWLQYFLVYKDRKSFMTAIFFSILGVLFIYMQLSVLLPD